MVPVLEYASDVWAFGKCKDEIEKIQLKFLKLLLGVRSNTSTAAIYAETGRFPIEIKFKLKMIKFWARLTRLDSNNIAKQVYQSLKYLSDLGYATCVMTAKNLLYGNGLSEVYETNYLSKQKESSVLNKVHDSLCKRFMEKCMSDIYKQPKLRLYVNFKTVFTIENYQS